MQHLPPPFCWHRYGNRQILPSPTEYPIMLRKNCIFPDHAARSSSPPAPTPFRPHADPLFDAIEFRCDADKTIVTPCVPSPRARVFNGAISWPFRGPFIDSNFAVILFQPKMNNENLSMANIESMILLPSFVRSTKYRTHNNNNNGIKNQKENKNKNACECDLFSVSPSWKEKEKRG